MDFFKKLFQRKNSFATLSSEFPERVSCQCHCTDVGFSLQNFKIYENKINYRPVKDSESEECWICVTSTWHSRNHEIVQDTGTHGLRIGEDRMCPIVRVITYGGKVLMGTLRLRRRRIGNAGSDVPNFWDRGERKHQMGWPQWLWAL